MTLTSTSPVQLLVLTGAILLIASSAALGAYYGYLVGSQQHQLTGLVFAAAALGGEILKPFAVYGSLESFSRWQIARGIACGALAIVCIIYSLASELSLAAGSRGDLIAARELAVEKVRSSKSARDRAEAELATMAPARDGLESKIATLRASPGANGCRHIDGPVSRRICNEAAELETEAARAKRRAELEAVLKDEPVEPPSGQQTVKDADPLATVLTVFAAAMGMSVQPGALSPWLVLIPVLFLELGSSLSLVVWRSFVSGAQQTDTPIVSAPDTKADTKADSIPDTRADTDRTPENPANAGSDVSSRRPNRTPSKPSKRTPSGDGGRRLGTNVVDLIKARGGQLRGGQRGIAKTLGLSKSRTNEVLRELAERGLIRLQAGRSGTYVQLVAVA